MTSDAFSHLKELEQWAAAAAPFYTRKLSFSEQCGVAYALLNRMPQRVVAKAFGLSLASASLLAQALRGEPKKHYRNVWQEYQSLGQAAFAERYYTRDLHFRLKRVKLELTNLPGGENDIARPSGPDPRADKYAIQNYGPVVIPDDGSHWKIYWREQLDGEFPTGWYFFRINPDPNDPGGLYPFIVRGAHSNRGLEEPEPFRTSSLAFDGVWEYNGLISPRVKPGRPAK